MAGRRFRFSSDFSGEVTFAYLDRLAGLDGFRNLRNYLEHQEQADCRQYRAVNHACKRNNETSHYQGYAKPSNM